MNANEVIANLALELLGRQRGDYQALHPNEHVNLSQSTNDAYPTALRLAAHAGVARLIDAVEQLRLSFARKADEFGDILKIGRTQLQDAAPMTLGQEFGSYVANGTIDLECGSTTNNLERKKQVAFAPAMFLTLRWA